MPGFKFKLHQGHKIWRYRRPAGGPGVIHYEPTRILVRFRRGTPRAERREILERRIRRVTNREVQIRPVERSERGDVVVYELTSGADSLELATELSEDSTRDDDIVWVEPDFAIAVPEDSVGECPGWSFNDQDDCTFTDSWYLDSIGYKELNGVFPQSDSVALAVVDSGVTMDRNLILSDKSFSECVTNPGIPVDRIQAQVNLVIDPNEDDRINAMPFDEKTSNAHGTAVLGFVAGNGDCGAPGVDPHCALYLARAFDDCNWSTQALLKLAVDVMLDAADQFGTNLVINLSYAKTSFGSEGLKTMCEEVAEAGALLVCGSGNDGTDGILAYPAEFAADFPGNVLAVGATTQDPLAFKAGTGAPANATEWVYSGSNTGPTLSVVAPGDNLRALYHNQQTSSQTGTSFATAIVSGVASLVWAANPTATAAEVIDALKKSAIPLDGVDKDSDYWGAGKVHLPGAIQEVKSAPS